MNNYLIYNDNVSNGLLDILLINDYITNGFKVEFLDILYIISILFGVFTIISRNPVVSVLFLIGLFVNVAGILILAGINYLGLSYILVYVGAISILFLFILMLINIRISELLSETNNDIPLAILTVLLFYYIIGQVLPCNLTDKTIISSLSNRLTGLYNIEISNESNIVSLNQEIGYVSSKG
ncbi:NADH-quinone oxidoreductase subunit J [Salinispora arenicola]|nr:NADH-quinone oxidoreductase subunit J [Salinispora arenicola]